MSTKRHSLLAACALAGGIASFGAGIFLTGVEMIRNIINETREAKKGKENVQS